MTMTLHSEAFKQGSDIPARYTCAGEDKSPPLAWQGVPPGTKSLVLIVDDPDAPDPDAPKMTWVHWVLYNIPAEVNQLPEGLSANDLPSGTKQGLNDWHHHAYGGPCPPIGRHRYFYKLYALDTSLSVPQQADKTKIEELMQGHVLESTELVGTFAKTA